MRKQIVDDRAHEDSFGLDTSMVDQFELREALMYILQGETDLIKKILILSFWTSFDDKDIGEALNIHPELVKQWRQSTLASIRTKTLLLKNAGLIDW